MAEELNRKIAVFYDSLTSKHEIELVTKILSENRYQFMMYNITGEPSERKEFYEWRHLLVMCPTGDIAEIIPLGGLNKPPMLTPILRPEWKEVGEARSYLDGFPCVFPAQPKNFYAPFYDIRPAIEEATRIMWFPKDFFRAR